jgi:hypothetical protein
MEEIKSESIVYVVLALYPHDFDHNQLGNFFAPAYVSLEVAINNHPDSVILKVHNTGKSSVNISLAYEPIKTEKLDQAKI